jgi:leucyl-tRNA synthetase
MNDIEQKWQKIWTQENAFTAIIDQDKPKYYALEMLPYPSGKIHIGHVRNYSIGDVIARYMKAIGRNVLHPMGWDAFGLPAENAAINNNSHPSNWTYANIESMRIGLKAMGFSYDWSKEIATCDPDYYKHEQKFFLELYQKNLAYQKESLVNWDPVDQTVLANEQVLDGRGWRSGAIVEKRYLKQWFLKITNYAEELLSELKNLDGWPEKVKLMQEKWIGKSEGANFSFNIKDHEGRTIEVYSTRPETIFGASFIGVAYNHPKIMELIPQTEEIKDFILKCSNMATSEVITEQVEKSGILTGLHALHPFDSNILIPIIITNYVMMDYGTGAIFGCPAHDERDHELAKIMGLPIIQVIDNIDMRIDVNSIPYTGDGAIINSSFLNGLSTIDAKQKIITQFETLGIGKHSINYRLKDWGISRQRFWGCPVPIIYCNDCGIVPVPYVDLPVLLPKNVTFDGRGNPLQNHPTWKNVNCPKCDKPATRETDTFDTFFESSWYFTRYCDNEAMEMTNKEACDYWLPVDQYIGGVEHAVMHLLYARFFTKVMNEQNYVSIREPFKNLLTQGMVLHATYKDSSGNFVYPDEVIKQGDKLVHKDTNLPITLGRVEKMSKSKKNIIDLDTILKNYGVDAVRLLVLSDSPPEKDLEYSMSGIDGSVKFITRLQNMFDEIINRSTDIAESSNSNSKLRSFIHYTIKHVTEDILAFRLNKAIARNRELFNAISDELSRASPDIKLIKESFTILLRLFNPFIPHITEELWEKLGNKQRLYQTNFPSYNETLLQSEIYIMAIQINGKLRDTYEFTGNIDDEEIKSIATNLPSIKKHLTDKIIKKIIIVPKKIINIVI